jgi:hypothetical protein
LVCGCPRINNAGNFVTVNVTSEAEVAQISHDGRAIDLTLWQNAAWDDFGLPTVYRTAAIAAVTAMADTQPVLVAAALLGATGQPDSTVDADEDEEQAS